MNYSYVPNSDLFAGYTSDSGIGVSYTYEARRNLKTAVENTYGMSVISRYAYRYDELGRRTDVVNTGTAFAESALSKYGYNDRSEVVSAERFLGSNPEVPGTEITDEKRTYAYDPIGNRKESVAGAQQAVIYETNVLNQYESLKNADETSVAFPVYDDDGNMTAYKDKACTWNAENRLVSVETADKKVDFLYDYMGRRVKKQVYAGSPGSWSLESEKQFVYDGWNLVQEIAVSGGTSDKYFVWGPDLSGSLQGAGGIGGLLCSVDSSQAYYFFYDGNGNVGQIVAENGSVASHYEYDAFGNAVAQSGACVEENSFRFSTKYFDAESGFYYYGFRYYLAELGRWGKRDPIGEKGGFSIYGFVFNNPVNTSDPFGLSLYAVDGTSSDIESGMNDYSNVHNFQQRSREEPNEYFGGPGTTGGIVSRSEGAITGTGDSGAQNLANQVYNRICEDYCNGHCEINMVGWSRGAVTVMNVAQRLNTEGCECGAPVIIHFIGLYDAVEMMPGDFGPATVPDNVQNFAHAIKTGIEAIFPTANYGGNRRAFPLTTPRLVPVERGRGDNRHYEYEPSFASTHGDIGRSATATEAHNWIIEEARAAGVDI